MNLASLRARLEESYSVALLERLRSRVSAYSPGDRLIFYALALLMAFTALVGLYALEQRLLVTVPARGGTLIEGEIGSPRFINPLLAISDADRDLSTLTHAGLMGLSGSGEFVPVLAESYEVSPDGKTYTFTLKKDAQFSDGSPLTSADVLFTVKKAQDPALKSPVYASWAGVVVEAPDALTVRFTLAKSYAPFLALTTLGILPAKIWQNISAEEFPFSQYQTNPIGAGPFVTSSIERDAAGLIESVTLAANERYILGRPYLDQIIVRFYAGSEDLVRARSTGAIESAYDVADTRVLTAPYARVFGVFFNPSEKQVFARLEVRKALSIAIDREHIRESVLGGYAKSVNGPVPPGSQIEPAPLPKIEGNLEAAAATLRESGWSYDGSARMWKHAGAKQTLDGVTIRTSNVPELRAVASAVKAHWEKLGVPVTVELYEPGDLSQNVIRPRNYEALLYGMVVGRSGDLYAFWSSQERHDPGLNIAQYANRTVDALLEEARTSADPSKRRAALEKIEETIASEYPAAFLYAPDFVYAIPDDLYGVALPQMVTPGDRFAEVHRWYRKHDRVWPIFVK